MIKSYKTAISRKTASAPLKKILSSLSKESKILDYGCGKGADGSFLTANGYNVDSYDPHWKPIDLNGKESSYDNILCTYVLNVLSEKDARQVVTSIKKYLKPSGKAYVAVRRDVKKDGETSRGYQRNVKMNLPVVYEKSNNYCIYLLEK